MPSMENDTHKYKKPSTANYENEFILKEHANKEYFQKEILPEIKEDLDFSKQENPKAYFTAGIPGAGKSKLVEAWEKTNPDIIIIDADKLRMEHPDIELIQKKYAGDFASKTHPDATRWVGELKKEAERHQANYIMDGSMRDPRWAKIDIETALKNNYSVEVTMLSVNKYEALAGVYDRYAKEYESDPNSARFVPQQLIKDASISIQDSAAVIDKLEIKHFKIVDRSTQTVFDSTKDIKGTAKEKLEAHTNLKNWSTEKLDTLKENFDKIITKLEEVKAPSNMIESAKTTQTNLHTEIKDIQQAKLYEKVKAFKESRPEKTQHIQQSKGMER